MTIPVYTVLTGDQAAEWIKKLAPRAGRLVMDVAAAEKLPPADASMIFLLAAIGMAKGGGFKVREFLTVLEACGVDVE